MERAGLALAMCDPWNLVWSRPIRSWRRLGTRIPMGRLCLWEPKLRFAQTKPLTPGIPRRVRLILRLSIETSGPGGTLVIPKGSDARLVIRKSSGGDGLSTSQLALDLDSVTIQGHRYVVSTEDIERSGTEGIGTNRRTAEMVGGGSVLGTLLGAIAGGGKGAAIGAVAGAVAGGTTQVLTRGSQVKVPVETVRHFGLIRRCTFAPNSQRATPSRLLPLPPLYY